MLVDSDVDVAATDVEMPEAPATTEADAPPRAPSDSSTRWGPRVASTAAALSTETAQTPPAATPAPPTRRAHTRWSPATATGATTAPTTRRTSTRWGPPLATRPLGVAPGDATRRSSALRPSVPLPRAPTLPTTNAPTRRTTTRWGPPLLLVTPPPGELAPPEDLQQLTDADEAPPSATTRSRRARSQRRRRADERRERQAQEDADMAAPSDDAPATSEQTRSTAAERPDAGDAPASAVADAAAAPARSAAAPVVAETWLLRFDGACPGNPGHGGAGAVLMDPSGATTWTCAQYLSARETNNTAEYFGLLAGLESALLHGVTRLRVEGDSKLVLSQVRGTFACRSRSLRALRNRAQALVRRFMQCKLVHIDRQATRRRIASRTWRSSASDGRVA